MDEIEYLLKKFVDKQIPRDDFLDKFVGKTIEEVHDAHVARGELFLFIQLPEFPRAIKYKQEVSGPPAGYNILNLKCSRSIRLIQLCGTTRSPEIVQALGGVSSEQFFLFKSYCCTAFNLLRKSANLILNLISLMLDAELPNINQGEQSLFKVQEKFRLDLNDEQANEVRSLSLLCSLCLYHIVAATSDYGLGGQVRPGAL